MSKRAALYLRVSTVDQHPETQLHDLHSLARQRGLEIVREYTDRISGTKAKRPGLDELLADARRAKFDVVLVWACDRIARSTRHFLEVLDEFNHLNIEFISFRENIDTGDHSGAPSSSSSARSPSWNATLLSSACVPGCAVQNSRVVTSAGARST